jgi:hypothetical protein
MISLREDDRERGPALRERHPVHRPGHRAHPFLGHAAGIELAQEALWGGRNAELVLESGLMTERELAEIMGLATLAGAPPEPRAAARPEEQIPVTTRSAREYRDTPQSM